MNNENKDLYINPEEIWWIYVYLIPKFLTKEGQIMSVLLEYGGVIEKKKDLYNKLKQNNITLTYQTFNTLFKTLLLKEYLIVEIKNKKKQYVINSKYIQETKEYKERILSQIN